MNERQKLLNDYVATSRAFADAVDRLSHAAAKVEEFIHALDEVGTAHRACEHTRVRLAKHLARLESA